MVKQYTQAQILEMLPNGWQDITFDFYLNKLLKVKVIESEDPLDAMETNLEITSLFLDMPKDIVEQFPVSTIKKINEKLSFLSNKPGKKKVSMYRWKEDLEEPSYDDFITFIKVSEQINNNDLSNFPLLIKIILKDKMKEEDILQMKMDEVEHGFFLLRQFSMKYLKSTTKDFTVKMIIQKIEEMTNQMNQIEGIQFKKRLKVINEKFKELMDGTSLPKKSQTSPA